MYEFGHSDIYTRRSNASNTQFLEFISEGASICPNDLDARDCAHARARRSARTMRAVMSARAIGARVDARARDGATKGRRARTTTTTTGRRARTTTTTTTMALPTTRGHARACACGACATYASARGAAGATRARRREAVVAGAARAANANASAAATPFVWKGANLVPLAASVGVGLVVNFIVPRPEAVVPQAWALLSIFLSTICGLVLGPLPVGAWAFVGLTTAVVTKTLSFQAAFGAMTNDVIWLIVLAFFFARGFVRTGLGDRVATMFVRALGKSTLGLSYGLTISEALLAPAMPSTTARAGGVYLPIITSLAKQAGSEPGPTSRKLGAFLVQTQLQSSGHSSAMCMTAAAQNLLSLKLAASLGIIVASPWITWFKAACVPAIIGLLVTPLLVYKLYPPEVQSTPDAPAEAAAKLKELGPLSQDELMVVATMSITVFMWIFQPFGIAPVVAAMFGMSLQLISGVISWAECLNEKGAWDTLLWFAVLIGMSGQLNALGFIDYLSTTVAGALTAANLAWPQVMLLLHGCYFSIHYLFASQTAQVAALSTAFMAMMMAAGAPPILVGLTMAFHTNLFGGITHYASGQSACYFGAGFVELKDYFRIGAICGVANVLIWLVFGGLWWKVIGLY